MKKNKSRKELSKLSIALIILLFPIIFILFGICIGFLINSFINQTYKEILTNSIFTILSGIVYIILLQLLIRTKDKENNKPFKWYINGILISFMFTLIISSITIITLQPNDGIINFLIGFSIFPLIGIITTPNIIKYVNKDTEGWKQIFYSKGNIHKINNSKDFYRVSAPVEFEKKILLAVYKEQLLNLFVVVGFMLFIIVISLFHLLNKHGYPSNMLEFRAERSFGLMFFLMIIFLAFGIPIITFYIANALKKIKVVRNHEYIVFHAIVSSVKNNKISIYNKNKYYKYNYCTCVGIKEKDIHNTPSILIFIPDDVLLFPDNDKYKIEKNKR